MIVLHFKRYFGSLAVVLTALAAYALAVVPWLQPPPVARRSADPASGLPLSSPARIDLAELFSPGSWELDNPKIVESEACTLLVKDYQTTPDGRLKLTPCTIIFYAEPAEPNGPRRPIVLQAPGGAEVQFDRPLNLARAQFGKLVHGKLPGEITIRSRATSPGAADDLYLTTSNIEIGKSRIYTTSAVEFRYGDSHGRGKDLSIALLPKDPEDPHSGVGGVRSITLEQIDRLHLESEGEGVFGGGPLRQKPGVAAGAAPLEVTCQGPLVFDVLTDTAMLDEGVEVARINPTGPPDKLTCRQLLLMFAGNDAAAGRRDASPSTAPANHESAQPSDPLAGRLKQIVAVGSPVTLAAPSSDTAAAAARIEYSLTSRRLLLVPGLNAEHVWLKQDRNEFTARELEYEFAEPGRLGRLWAAGPGQLKFVQFAGPARQTVVARWEKELRLRPEGRNQVVSLVEGASITFDPLGEFAASELHLWLLEERGQGTGDKEREKTTILPDRLLAIGGVWLDSPQLHIDTARLEVWFQNQPDRPQPLPPVAQAGHQQPVDLAAARPGAQPLRPPSLQRFHLSGDLIQMQVVRQGELLDLEDLLIRGNVVLDETRTPQPGQKPVRIRGQRLELRGGVTGPGMVDIVGHPAEVGGRGMSLAGGEIHLVRSENRLWIDGPGEARLPAALGTNDRQQGRSGNGQSMTPPEDVHVVWQDRFNFDGQTAEMHGEVQARTATQVASARRLAATLSRRLDFAAAASRDNADLSRLELDGGVHLVSRGLDERGEQVSYDQVQVPSVVIDRAAGTLHADGPGQVSSTRVAGAELGGLAEPQPPPTRPADLPGPPKLNYIHIEFQGAIEGELARRQIEFQRQVRTTFAPVADWDQRVVATRLEELGEQGVLMTSDRLMVVEMLTAGRPRWLEATATGNALVEGKTFTIHAPKISYTSDKRLLTLEGNGRAEAELLYRALPGQPNSYSAAAKWQYWLDSGMFKVEGIKVFDFRLLDTGKFKLPGQR
jgi:hypothetical protein